MKYAVSTHTIDNKKTKVRNSIVTLILLAFGISASAQHLSPPKTYWQSFGYQKQPDHIKRAYYKSDSLDYEPTKAEVISQNYDGTPKIYAHVRIGSDEFCIDKTGKRIRCW